MTAAERIALAVRKALEPPQVLLEPLPLVRREIADAPARIDGRIFGPRAVGSRIVRLLWRGNSAFAILGDPIPILGGPIATLGGPIPILGGARFLSCDGQGRKGERGDPNDREHPHG